MTWRPGKLKHLSSVPITNGLGEAGIEGEPDWPRYIRTTDIAGPRELRDDIRAALPPSIAARAMLKRGDIVFTAAGATIGKSLLYDEAGQACYAGYLVRVRPARGIDGRFVSYWAQSQPYWAQLETGKVVSTIENFSASKYQNLELMVPPRSEQCAIADFLDAETARIDTLIAKKRLMVEVLRSRAQAIIDLRAVPTALGGEADAVGTSWTVTSVKRVASPFTDGDWIESPYITDGGIRLIQTGNIGRGTFIDKGFRYISDETFTELQCTEVLPGDVLVSRLAGSLGQACISPSLGVRMVTSVDVVILRTVDELLPEFAVLYLSSQRHLREAEQEARGSIMMRLARSQVGELPIPVPPINVQKSVVNEIAEAKQPTDRAIRMLERQLKLLRERRRALITAAVTGQMEVPEAGAG